ncbi:hypothetical protein BS47DRAFT_1303098, partial [Hydnum rufescens UP504]
LPNGSTILGIILASDKTHLMNYSGNKSMHAVYLTLRNIQNHIHQKTTHGGWMLVAKIPTLKFANTSFTSSGMKLEAERMPGILQKCLFHACMQIVLEPLRIEQRRLQVVTGPDGYHQHCMPILMAWIADLEEQLLIAGVSQWSCPVCMVSHNDLQAHKNFTICTGNSTLETLTLVCAKYPSASTWEFYQEVKRIQ